MLYNNRNDSNGAVSVEAASEEAASVETTPMGVVSVKTAPGELFSEEENGHVGGLFHEEDFVCCIGGGAVH
ncbi:MAG: hypothetical protein NC341_08410 [Blautia sp.]|nr:hypothetical protein [Blautia sp.]